MTPIDRTPEGGSGIVFIPPEACAEFRAVAADICGDAMRERPLTDGRRDLYLAAVLARYESTFRDDPDATPDLVEPYYRMVARVFKEEWAKAARMQARLADAEGIDLGLGMRKAVEA